MATTTSGKFEKYFEEMAIRLDQSNRDGKTIMSTKSMSSIMKNMAKLAKELGK